MSRFVVLLIGLGLLCSGWAFADSEPVLDRVRVLAVEGRLGEATVELERALQNDPDDPDLLFMMGDTYRRAGRISDATDWWGKALAADPKYWRADYNLGIAYSKRLAGLYDLPRAIEHFKSVLEATPEHAGAHAHLARLYLRRVEYEQAIEEAGKALALDPGLAEMEYIRAEIARRQNDLDGGIEILRSAVRAHPEDGRLKGRLVTFLALSARALAEKGESEAAWDKYWEAVQTEPPDLKLWEEMLGFAGRSGDPEKALKMADRFAAQYPENPDALNGLAFALAERGERLDEAVEAVRKAIRLVGGTTEAPKLPVYFDTLGWVYYKQMDYRQAGFNLGIAERAVPPSNPGLRSTVLYHRAQVYEASGEPDRARSDYEEALGFAAGKSALEKVARQCRAALERLEAKCEE